MSSEQPSDRRPHSQPKSPKVRLPIFTALEYARHMPGQLTPLDRALFLRMVYRDGRGGGAHESQATMADSIGCLVTSVRRSLGRLTAAGMIRKSGWHHRAGRKGTVIYDTDPGIRLMVRAAAAANKQDRGVLLGTDASQDKQLPPELFHAHDDPNGQDKQLLNDPTNSSQTTHKQIHLTDHPEVSLRSSSVLPPSLRSGGSGASPCGSASDIGGPLGSEIKKKKALPVDAPARRAQSTIHLPESRGEDSGCLPSDGPIPAFDSHGATERPEEAKDAATRPQGRKRRKGSEADPDHRDYSAVAALAAAFRAADGLPILMLHERPDDWRTGRLALASDWLPGWGTASYLWRRRQDAHAASVLSPEYVQSELITFRADHCVSPARTDCQWDTAFSKHLAGRVQWERGGSRLTRGWCPDADHAALAARLGVDLRHEAHQFRDYYLSRGAVRVDWGAAFALWLRRGADTGQALKSSDNVRSSRDMITALQR